jgi:hypothetical protein
MKKVYENRFFFPFLGLAQNLRQLPKSSNCGVSRGNILPPFWARPPCIYLLEPQHIVLFD